MKGKKVIYWGMPGGNGGTVQISSWKCNFNIYLDIQVYYLDIQPVTKLLCLYWFLMCCFLLFIQIVYVTTALLKSIMFRYSKA